MTIFNINYDSRSRTDIQDLRLDQPAGSPRSRTDIQDLRLDQPAGSSKSRTDIQDMDKQKTYRFSVSTYTTPIFYFRDISV